MKRIIVISIVCVVGGVLAFLMVFKQEPEISTSLSERSKEYLATKKEGSNLEGVYLGEKEELVTGKRIAVDECFSFVVPFALKTERRDSACDYYLAIQNPRGSITAYLKKEPATSWESVPGVRMRQQSPWAYTEEKMTVSGKEFLTFRKKDEGLYERNAFYYTPAYFIVINLSANTTENLDYKFKVMLESVELK